MPNRLINESSPYLQQHANNPLDWFPWGDEAFGKAKKEKKPIFLSIGYSSCHWCHVMEEQVFEDEKIAELTNNTFISIKVDKEERPDLDKYYQNLYAILNSRGGGWPLSIFLTHDLKPFYSATYIPPETFVQIIEYFENEYKHNYEELEAKSNEIEKFSKMLYKPNGEFTFDNKFIEEYENSILKDYDRFYGGYSKAPKFPHASLINNAFILNDKCAKSALQSLKEMSKGGFYDLVDSGFCRYSVDDIWLVPHFEKMTYDNGLLSESYIYAYKYSNDSYYLNIAKNTIDFMYDKMSENNLFYSASDADSINKNGDKEEGAYFVYEYDELCKHLDKQTLKRLDITPNGNFEGKNIIRDENLLGIDNNTLKILQDVRSNNTYPFIDKKVIVSWNAMMIKSVFLLSSIDNSYLEKAIESIDSILEAMYIDNTLYHSKLITLTDTPTIEAFLEDYAYLIDTLLTAYQSTLDDRYFTLAYELSQTAIEKYYKDGRWFFSSSEFITEADVYDSSYPSSIGIILNSFITIGAFKDVSFFDIVNKTLSFYSSMITRAPTNFSSILKAIIRLNKDEQIVKSKKENLLKIKEKDMDLIVYENKEDNISICGLNSCYKSFEELNSFFKAI